jgi:hypothetical protein
MDLVPAGLKLTWFQQVKDGTISRRLKTDLVPQVKC